MKMQAMCENCKEVTECFYYESVEPHDIVCTVCAFIVGHLDKTPEEVTPCLTETQ